MNFDEKYYESAAKALANGLGQFLMGPLLRMFKLIANINKSSLEVKRLKKILIMHSDNFSNESNNLGRLLLSVFFRHFKTINILVNPENSRTYHGLYYDPQKKALLIDYSFNLDDEEKQTF